MPELPRHQSSGEPIVAHAHSGYVQIGAPAGSSRAFYFAVCSTCGWQAVENRRTGAEASRDLANHVAATGVRLG